MRMFGRQPIVLTAFILSIGFVPSARAVNECQGKVSVQSVSSAGTGVRVAFKVKTSCARSAGRFAYSYEASTHPGKSIERNAPSWSAGSGNDFVWKDIISPGGGVKVSKVKVISGSIETTKQ